MPHLCDGIYDVGMDWESYFFPFMFSLSMRYDGLVGRVGFDVV